MKGFARNDKGSFTLEAALIVPIVLLILMGIIFTSMIVYQQAYVQSVATFCAQKYAGNIDNHKKDIFFGQVDKDDLKEPSLYQLFSRGEEEDEFFQKFTAYYGRKNRIKGKTEDGREYEVIAVLDFVPEKNIENYLVYKKVTIEVSHKYNIPMGNLLSIFGIGEEVTLKAKADAISNDPVEFIRNTDFFVDTAKEIGDATGLTDKIGSVVAKIGSIFTK